MKKLFLLCILFIPYITYGQCAEGSVCVKQTVVDKCANAADELLAARTAIAKLEAERDVNTIALNSAKLAIDSLQRAIETGKEIQAQYVNVVNMLKDALKTAFEIIDRQNTQMNKHPSAWKQFVTALKNIAILLAGASLARGL